MKAVVPASSESAQLVSLCLLDDRQGVEPRKLAGIGLASVAINLLVLLGMGALASIEGTPPRPLAPAVDARKSVTLIAPSELTQRAPNKTEVAKDLHLEELLAKPEVKETRKLFTPPPAPKPVPPSPAAPPPSIEPPAPARMAQALPPALGNNPNIPPPPAAPPQEKPKLAFETPGAPGGSSSQRVAGFGHIAPPKNSVDEAVKSMTRGGPSGVVIGDIPDESGLGRSTPQSSSPTHPATNIELLSDPMGVDFKPYLVRVLAAVRRNWFAVIPESARLGHRGKVLIQFSISKTGSVPKLVIVLPSGTEGLDRAAVAGISASNPFPPLPPEFRGDQIRLQLAFFYNVPTR